MARWFAQSPHPVKHLLGRVVRASYLITCILPEISRSPTSITLKACSCLLPNFRYSLHLSLSFSSEQDRRNYGYNDRMRLQEPIKSNLIHRAVRNREKSDRDSRPTRAPSHRSDYARPMSFPMTTRSLRLAMGPPRD